MKIILNLLKMHMVINYVCPFLQKNANILVITVLLRVGWYQVIAPFPVVHVIKVLYAVFT